MAFSLKNDAFFCSRSGNPTIHVQNLLLLLPSIRQADSIIRQFWRNVCQNESENGVDAKKLFAEMLVNDPYRQS